jgi:hypothetical protein
VHALQSGAFGSPSLVRVGKRSEQNLESFRRLGVTVRRMQARQRLMRQDVDRRTASRACMSQRSIAAILRGERGDSVGEGIQSQLAHEVGRLRPFRGLVFEGR